MRRLMLIICLGIMLVGCSNQTTTEEVTEDTNSGAVENTESTEFVGTEEEEETEESTAPVGIPGSHYTDIVLNCEKLGLTEHEFNSAEEDAQEYYRYTASAMQDVNELDIRLDYYLLIDEDYQVISGTFGASWLATQENSVFEGTAGGYLGFCATMPYDSADGEAAKEWVFQNLQSAGDLNGETVTTTIGDAKYSMYGTNTDGNYTSFVLKIEKATEVE